MDSEGNEPMNTKSRNLLITVAVVILSVMVWSVVAAQDATAEPGPAATTEASPMTTTEPNMSATMEANPSDMTAHPFLGVSLQDGTDGVTVAEVVDGSAAATAGIKVGDMITAIDGTKVTTAAEAASAVATHKVGDSVTIDLTRDGSTMTVTATLGTQPAQTPMRPGQGRGNGNGNGRGNGNGQFPPNFAPMMPFLQYAYGNGHLGVTFQNLDADVAKTNNLTVTDGALVTEVEAGSPAEKAGLKVNDVITAVDGDKVDQERTLRDRLIAYEPGDVVTLTVLRDGASQDIQATLDQPQMTAMGNGNFPFNFNFQGPRGFRFGQPGQNGQNNPEATPEATPNL
jgi:C-terminal processing protease CtpA/Prc